VPLFTCCGLVNTFVEVTGDTHVMPLLYSAISFPPEFFSCSQVDIDFWYGTCTSTVPYGDVVTQESLYFTETQAAPPICNSVKVNTGLIVSFLVDLL
jgi:hypothetical protein